MILPKTAKTIGAALLVGLQASRLGVDAHGYLKTPRSRNFVASIDPIWWGGTADDPAPENCPHCLNIGGTEAQCGIVGDHNYDYPPNAIGSGVLSTNLQACYEEGAVIDVESVLTAHHKGHFELRACPISPGEAPTEDCFKNNPLTFVSDELYHAQPDPLYPGRAYIPRTDYPGGLSRETNGNYNFHHTFKLPDGLVADLVLIQWYYVTGNSCMAEGYDTYDWPEGFYPGNTGIGVCDSIPPDGRGVPEQFWNCAEVEIKVAGGCGTTSPATTLSPTKAPTDVITTSSPTLSPMEGISTSTTSSTSTSSTLPNTPNPNPNCKTITNTCGLNKPCAEGYCCSQWGSCGTSAAYCGDCCQNGACFNSPGTSAPSKSPSTTTGSTVTTTSATTTTTSTSSIGELVLNSTPRCGFSEIDAREHCKQTCATDADCEVDGEFCYVVHSNYCGSIPQRIYEQPERSPVVSRCGISEEMARTFCGEECSWQCSKPGESCIAVHANWCDSKYTEVVGNDTTVATTTSSTVVSTTTASDSATNSPSTSPTEAPTSSPIVPTTLMPSSSPISRPPSSSAALAVEAVLEANKEGMDNNILLYQEPSMQWVPSTVYRYSGLLDGLRVMYNDGVANKYFYMGDDSPAGHLYGLVNIAAFLAQSMKETIQYNACDENSWDLVNGRYPISNACGQLGQSYQDYKCSASEAHMECEVKADMEITATTNAKWWGAPAPLYCGPKSKLGDFTGFWDHSKECNKPWANPPETCDVYEGQLAGGFDNSSPVPNSSGRTDVEGCCFWGRGVIQTTGVCNFGKLNYYLGKRAADEGRDARYPTINFCETPNAICDSEEHKELKWIAGMFYWVESLQSYNVGSWNYINELHKFVDEGMTGNSFIDAVSGIVNRGCHNPPCATGDVDGKSDRSSNFFKVLRELDLV